MFFSVKLLLKTFLLVGPSTITSAVSDNKSQSVVTCTCSLQDSFYRYLDPYFKSSHYTSLTITVIFFLIILFIFTGQLLLFIYFTIVVAPRTPFVTSYAAAYPQKNFHQLRVKHRRHYCPSAINFSPNSRLFIVHHREVGRLSLVLVFQSHHCSLCRHRPSQRMEHPSTSSRVNGN